MKFTVNDKTYFVKWEYLLKFQKIPFNTICRIYDNEHSYDKPIVIGGAVCKPPDKFCKNTGRKISLERALNKLFPYSYHIEIINKGAAMVPDEINTTHQEYRTIAWQEYFKESPKRLK